MKRREIFRVCATPGCEERFEKQAPNHTLCDLCMLRRESRSSEASPERTHKYVSAKQKHCHVCRAPFAPRNNRQYRCDDCSPYVQGESGWVGTLLRDAGFDIEKKDGQWVVHVGDETITIVERRPGEQIGDFDPHDVAGFLRACGYEVVRSRSKLIVTVGDRHP